MATMLDVSRWANDKLLWIDARTSFKDTLVMSSSDKERYAAMTGLLFELQRIVGMPWEYAELDTTGKEADECRR